MQIDLAILAHMWPHAPDALLSAVSSRSAAVLSKYHIDTPLRFAHFMAQISHESNGGTVTAENLNYTTASRIAAVWPSRFTEASAQAYVRNPQALADKVYSGRMGNTRPGDGFKYRGRGLLQLTGRESYTRLGSLCGLDLVGDPDLAFAPDTALDVAAAEFVSLNCLPACDADDIRAVTKRVNGGYIGLDSREAWLGKWKRAASGMTVPPPPDIPKPDTTTTPQPAPRGLFAALLALLAAIFKRKP